MGRGKRKDAKRNREDIRMSLKLTIKESRENIGISYRIYEGKKKTGEVRFPISHTNKQLKIKRIHEEKATTFEILGEEEREKGNLAKIYNEEGKKIGSVWKRKESLHMNYHGKDYTIKEEIKRIEIRGLIKATSVIEMDEIEKEGITYRIECEKERDVTPAIILTIVRDYIKYGRYDIGRYRKELIQETYLLLKL